jgi:DNA-binding MarR family transcriptional regulator
MELEKEIKQKNFRNDYHKAVVNLIFTYNWLYSHYSEFLKSFNLTIQQFNILRILRGQHPKPATIKLLKERMLDKMSDASRIVEKLKTKGFVERQICEKDRRTVDVYITDKGMELLENIDERNDKLDKIMSMLNAEEINMLNNLLDKLRG